MALTEKTTTTVGFLILAAASFAGGGLWLRSQFEVAGERTAKSLEAAAVDLAIVKRDLRELSFVVERMSDRLSDQWTQTKMEAWTLRLSRDNPTIKVPEIH